ncbi:acyltransferase family protein [Luteibacter yeojuensis]|uniref:DhaL domain-containing protein n=1 Tax=Luteibacter yeojuensis TaxID=345309 RepID=A0A0F3KI47_9GAMM|nr:acyltransferase [Luteibacter yeojuensis]KJV30935.1 hypothetical protein VI08_14410 [Luteibacter yeojuensis]
MHSQPLAYRPAIDGIRAIAVLGVVLYHAGFGPPGSFVGVDVFFVISGFLIITSMRKAIGGSSGPFYATGLMRAARELTDVAEPTPLQWCAALAGAADAIAELGGAKTGDRTMLDALSPPRRRCVKGGAGCGIGAVRGARGAAPRRTPRCRGNRHAEGARRARCLHG